MPTDTIKLSKPMYDSDVSVEKALLGKRSHREYKKEPLTLDEVSQLLWAMQGVTDPEGFRRPRLPQALFTRSRFTSLLETLMTFPAEYIGISLEGTSW
jgi:hypothetical protein